MGNLRSTITLLEGMRLGLNESACTVSTYNLCRSRAWKFLHGEDFLAVTRGKKTRNFFQNILTPEDPHPVTIDGHMFSIWQGKRMTMKEAVYMKLDYDAVADGTREIAQEHQLRGESASSNALVHLEARSQCRVLAAAQSSRQLRSLLLDIDPSHLKPFTLRRK